MLVFTSTHRLKGLFSTSISNVGFLISSQILHICTISSSESAKRNFMVEFLIDSVGFTRESAISASSKIPNFLSTKSPQSVVNILKNYSLDENQIREIISSVPKILTCRPTKTLEPKIRVFREYGFCGQDLADLIKRNPYLLRIGLHTRIIPYLDLIKKFTCSNEEAIVAIKKAKCLFCTPLALKKCSANVLQLQTRGLSHNQIVEIITKHRWGATINPLVFERRLVWIVQELGIPENSRMFFYAVFTITRLKKSSIERKLKLLRSYGWSEKEIATFGRSNPINLAYSKAKIRDWLDFFMKEVGYTPAYLVTCLYLLSSSLEKKVKPRYKILEILKEMKLVSSKPKLATVVSYTELRFLEFMKRFENELPGLVETYNNSIRKTQS